MPTRQWYWTNALPVLKQIVNDFYQMWIDYKNLHNLPLDRFQPNDATVDANIQNLKHLLQQGFRSFVGPDIAALDAIVEETRALCPESMRVHVSQWWNKSRESIVRLQAEAQRNFMFSSRRLENPYVLDFCV